MPLPPLIPVPDSERAAEALWGRCFSSHGDSLPTLLEKHFLGLTYWRLGFHWISESFSSKCHSSDSVFISLTTHMILFKLADNYKFVVILCDGKVALSNSIWCETVAEKD